MKDEFADSKILIVDDVETNLDIIVSGLGSRYRIRVALDGKDALKSVANDPPDLILLDIMMPGMDGYEVCEALKKEDKHFDIPVIFLTAKSENVDIIRGFEVGAVDYVTKPFNLDELRMRINTHLELRAARKKIEEQNNSLVQASRFRDDVDHIIRHDLKSPLNSIVGFPQIIKRREPDLSEKTIHYLDVIYEAGTRMGKMIDLSLYLIKMEEGEFNVPLRPVNMVSVLAQIKNDLQPLISAKQVDIAVQAPESFLVLGEEILCYSLLANLIKNAVEAAPEESKISISANMQDRDGLIKIHNEGSVPEEVRERFFEKFVTQGKKHGTGLGTYSAWLITQNLKGQIYMQSSEQAGTMVTVHLQAPA